VTTPPAEHLFDEIRGPVLGTVDESDRRLDAAVRVVSVGESALAR
jgi:hypothetical protein